MNSDIQGRCLYFVTKTLDAAYTPERKGIPKATRKPTPSLLTVYTIRTELCGMVGLPVFVLRERVVQEKLLAALTSECPIDLVYLQPIHRPLERLPDTFAKFMPAEVEARVKPTWKAFRGAYERISAPNAQPDDHAEVFHLCQEFVSKFTSLGDLNEAYFCSARAL